jgi:predicted HTH domain antitoxin
MTSCNAARLSEAEFRVEMAALLCQQDRLMLGQAAACAGLPQIEMQRVLASRRIPVHYSLIDASNRDSFNNSFRRSWALELKA